MCDGRYFSQDLHYTVNLKSGTYNAETLKKCALQVAQKVFRYALCIAYYQSNLVKLNFCEKKTKSVKIHSIA